MEALRRYLGLGPIVSIHDKTLHEIARVLPRSRGQLREISGVGATKLERYGPALREVVQANRQSTPGAGAASDPASRVQT